MRATDLDGRRTLPLAAVHRAQLLAGAIRDREPEAIEELLGRLDRQELIDLAFTAAAMIPTDHTPRELLQWNDAEVDTAQMRRHGRRIAACGTSAGYQRHRDNGEPPCWPCRTARSTYDAQRYQARRRLTVVGGA